MPKCLRTADRPLPAECHSRRQVSVFAAVTTAIGMSYLILAGNPMLALLAAAGWLLYAAIYTPLKTRSVWQTPAGAVAGAMPVLLGASAA